MATRRRIRKSFIYRTVFRNFRFRRSPVDLWLGLFFLTVLLGVWYSFSAQMALFKFWNVTASIALFYAITAVSRRDAWWVVGFCGPMTAVLVINFVAAKVWVPLFAFAGGIFKPLMFFISMQRFWPIMAPHPNVIGGLLTMFMPFVVAYGFYVNKRGQRNLFLITVICGVLAVIGLLLTRSVGAWFALAVGSTVWLLWLASKPLSGFFRVSRGVTYGLSLFLSLVGMGTLFWILLQTNVPGMEASSQRSSLFGGTWRLIQDYPYTGSGLASFPALYSEYIQVVPNFFVSYGNLYLDVLLELGAFGFVFLLIIWTITFWRLVQSLRRSLARPSATRGELYWLRWAALVSLVVIVVHGFFDDTLFGGLGTPFLFFTPAIAILVSRRRSSYETGLLPHLGKRSFILILGSFIVGVCLVLGFRQPLSANWFANQGALQMDRVLLHTWPQNEWRQSIYFSTSNPVQAQFEQALQKDEQNKTAHQRLGMIAYLNQDFSTAVAHLEVAFEQDMQHRGYRKLLGYSYVWLGQFESAAHLLKEIPESQSEMDAYSNWWQERNQPDLAKNASDMAQYLD